MDLPKLKPASAELLRQIWSPPVLIDRVLRRVDHRLSLIHQIAEIGDPAAILPIFALVKEKSLETVNAASDCVNRLLLKMPPQFFPALDVEARRFYGWCVSVEWWSRLTPAQVATLPKASGVLGVASCHSNGYVREEAIRELNRIDDGSEIPFLLLRANDWVANVRIAAKSAIHRRLVPSNFDQFIQYVHLVIRLAESGRDKNDDIVEWFMSQLICSQHERVLFEIVQSPDHSLSRMLFQRATELEGEHRNQLVLVGLQSADVVLRSRAAHHIRLSFPSKELADAFPAMAQDRFMPVRREALLARIERTPDQASVFLEKALWDESASMRHVARFYLGKIGRTNIADIYRLAISRNPQTGLLGLSETGTIGDVKFAVPFLNDPSIGVRAAAIRVIVNLAVTQFVEELTVGLQDKSKRVSLVAKKGLQSQSVVLSPERLWDIGQHTPYQHVRFAVTELLDRTGTWTAIPFLLKLSIHSDERLASRARQLIVNRFNRVYTAPNSEDRKRITMSVEECRSNLPPSFLNDFEQWLACRI